MVHDTQSAQISQKQDVRNIYAYAIIRTMCPPGYYHNGFVATNALGHMMFGSSTIHHVPKCMSCHKATAVIPGKGTLFSCFHIYTLQKIIA